MVNKLDELLNVAKMNDLMNKKEEKKKNCVIWGLAIIGAVAAVAGIAYAVYRYFTPDYLEDFEDDFEDDFDDDFFDDDEEEEETNEEETKTSEESKKESKTE